MQLAQVLEAEITSTDAAQNPLHKQHQFQRWTHACVTVRSFAHELISFVIASRGVLCSWSAMQIRSGLIIATGNSHCAARLSLGDL